MSDLKTIKAYKDTENFPVASKAIPKQARKTIKAIYEFARNADNISDSPDLDKKEAKSQLEVILKYLNAKADHKLPVWAKKYTYYCRSGKISIRHGKALLQAFIEDTVKNRYNSWDETLAYSQKSAATIGRMVLEANREYSADFFAADKVCIVLQLINHLQDAKEDYQKINRIYFDKSIFPNEDDLNLDSETIEVTRGKNQVISKLRKLLDESSSLPSTIFSFRVRAEIYAIIEIAYKLLDELESQDIMKNKVKLKKSSKVKALLVGLFKSICDNFKDSTNKLNNELYAKDSSFFKPMLSLKREKREDMMCFYAFCKLIDDSADDGASKADSIERLTFWQNEINKIYSSNNIDYPEHPITRNLISVIEKNNIPREYFDEMIEGQLMDVNEIMLKPERNIFYLYCYRVASCVGIITAKILGYKDKNEEQIIRFATHLGKGFQIVNIIRDIQEDAISGRIYIPQRVLLRNNLVELEPEQIADNYEKYKEQFASASKELAELAKEHFIISEESMPLEEKHNMKIPLLMRNVYIRYLEKMQNKDFVFNKKDIKLSFLDKIKIFS